jgi:hypothetical protein
MTAKAAAAGEKYLECDAVKDQYSDRFRLLVTEAASIHHDAFEVVRSSYDEGKNKRFFCEFSGNEFSFWFLYMLLVKIFGEFLFYSGDTDGPIHIYHATNKVEFASRFYIGHIYKMGGNESKFKFYIEFEEFHAQSLSCFPKVYEFFKGDGDIDNDKWLIYAKKIVDLENLHKSYVAKKNYEGKLRTAQKNRLPEGDLYLSLPVPESPVSRPVKVEGGGVCETGE